MRSFASARAVLVTGKRESAAIFLVELVVLAPFHQELPMKKFSWLRRDRAPVALLTMFVVGACSNDVPQQITESPRTSVFTQGDPEREALRRLARGIAMGLG